MYILLLLELMIHKFFWSYDEIMIYKFKFPLPENYFWYLED